MSFQKNFHNSIHIFQSKKPDLPYKISWKLDLIIHLINGNQIKKQLLDIDQQLQYQDLENLNVPCLKILFFNIVHTLFYQTQSMSKFKTCSLKKKGLFNNWTNATIAYDSSKFIIKYSNKTKHYDIDDCQIKKSKENQKCFELNCQKNIKYVLKFQNQSTMKNNMKELQKKLIESKTTKNYQEMTHFIDCFSPKFMADTNIFTDKQSFVNNRMALTAKKSQSVTQKFSNTNFKQTSKSPPSNQILSKQFFHNVKSQLKPVPHGYVPKYQTEHIIIALRETNESKIYIEYNLHIKISMRNLVTYLMIQKGWNKFLVFEKIEKSKFLPNEVHITRKFDTFETLGEFLEMNQKYLYTSFTDEICMITAENYDNTNTQLHSKTLMTIQYKNTFPKIFIEDELSSDTYSVENLKNMLFDIHKEIVKLELMQDRILIKNFQAKTLIQNIVEEQASTEVESGKQSCSNHEIEIQYPEQNEQDSIESSIQADSSIQSKSKLPLEITKGSLQLIPIINTNYLNSPLQIPTGKFVSFIRKKQFQKHYFKHRFSQQILEVYDNYVPYYRVDKMLENKEYQILPDTKQLKFINQKLIDSQKDTLKFILKQVGANLISGKSILNVSLPVDIFQSRTGLQREAAAYAYSPDLFQPVAMHSTEEQIKKVVAFIAGQTSTQLVMKKPFNPILGQTFQCYIKGIPIYWQQTSHCPPISSYFMKCDEYQMHGNLIAYADMGLNNAVGGNLGPIRIKLKNGSDFECFFAPSEISGLIYGDRKFRFYNRGYIFERSKNLYGQFSVQNQKKGIYQVDRKLKASQIIGGIYRVKSQYFDEVDKFKKTYKNLKKFPGITKQFIIQKLNEISGDWFGDIFVDKQQVNKDINLYPVEYPRNVLPSDSNYRLDVIYHRMNNSINSQKEKEILEIAQRNDRKLREKYAEKRKNESKK